MTNLFFLPQTAFASTVLSQNDVTRLKALCTDSSITVNTTDKKHLLLFHRDGYVPDLHDQLPDSMRAVDLDHAAAVLCLDDDIEELEVCEFGVFFSIPRQRQRFRVEAIPLDPAGERHSGLFMSGPAPAQCSSITNVDNSIAFIRGGDISISDALEFITDHNLDRGDNDRDGLKNLEEFRIGSNPDSAASPAAQAEVRLNGSTQTSIYEGDIAELRLNLYPGQHLGNQADYLVWADTPDGQQVYQYPAGFLPSSTIDPVISGPLARLFNFRLARLRNLVPGEYQFHFEARDSNGSIERASSTLTVVADPCREELSLPLSIDSDWNSSCVSAYEEQQGYLARYYTFTLTRQSAIALFLNTDFNSKLVLRQGKGRSGIIFDLSSPSADGEQLFTTLLADTYTVEVILEQASANSADFALASSSESLSWHFTEVSSFVGIDHEHGYKDGDLVSSDPSFDRRIQGGGVAAGDYDQDGWTDLYFTGGTIGPNYLYRNLSNGRFEEVASQAGVALEARFDTGATFTDINGDGWPDLFVGGIDGAGVRLFRNRQNGTFEDITEASGLAGIDNGYSASFADYDRDGDLDMYMTHWNDSSQGNYLFQNDGTGFFTDVSEASGIPKNLMADYTANFSDINNDGWLDLLVAADFNTSQIYLNNGNGTFSNITDKDIITDDNGMGAAVGDYDNDGDMDWFVSSIFDPNGLSGDVLPGTHTGASGNRLYNNQGDGTFQDVTETAGVRIGGWGWGSCFADFNNDGWLDIFHVNGYITTRFTNNEFFLSDASRIFISNRDGTFTGSEQSLGLIDKGMGKGISCLDYDLDGDIDIVVANNGQPPSLYRNDGGNDNNFIHLRIAGEGQNYDAIGARITLVTGNLTQTREISNGSNFISNNPSEAYFGLGASKKIDRIEITWPDGDRKTLTNISANQMLTIFK